MFRIKLIALAGMLALVGTACSIDIERNADGSLQVVSAISQESLSSEIALAIADPQVREFDVDLENGYVLVSAERQEVLRDEIATMTFRLDLDVVSGHLGAVVSNAEINGESVPQPIVDVWNEKLATQLERAGRRNPDATLVRVSITQDDVTMEWRVETAESRS